MTLALVLILAIITVGLIIYTTNEKDYSKDIFSQEAEQQKLNRLKDEQAEHERQIVIKKQIEFEQAVERQKQRVFFEQHQPKVEHERQQEQSRTAEEEEKRKAERVRAELASRHNQDQAAKLLRLKVEQEKLRLNEEKKRKEELEQKRLNAQEEEEKNRQYQLEVERQKQLQLAERRKQEEQRKYKEELERKQKAERQKRLAFFESETEYSTNLDVLYNRNPEAFQFTTIRSLSSNCGVFNELSSGIAQLNTYEQLSQYIFSYGLMHQAKLQQAFQILFDKEHSELSNDIIEIIDYGCGQGLGTVCLLDYIKSTQKNDFAISKVTLIEPSGLALKRAALNVHYALQSAGQHEDIVPVHKELDNLVVSDLTTDKASIKVHIFSNIIDVEYSDVNRLYSKIIESQKGINFFICVSPNIMQSRNRRLDFFQRCFENSGVVLLVSHRQNDIPNPRDTNKPWRRYERIFKVDMNKQKILKGASMNTEEFEDNDLPF